MPEVIGEEVDREEHQEVVDAHGRGVPAPEERAERFAVGPTTMADGLESSTATATTPFRRVAHARAGLGGEALEEMRAAPDCATPQYQNDPSRHACISRYRAGLRRAPVSPSRRAGFSTILPSSTATPSPLASASSMGGDHAPGRLYVTVGGREHGVGDLDLRGVGSAISRPSRGRARPRIPRAGPPRRERRCRPRRRRRCRRPGPPAAPVCRAVAMGPRPGSGGRAHVPSRGHSCPSRNRPSGGVPRWMRRWSTPSAVSDHRPERQGRERPRRRRSRPQARSPSARGCRRPPCRARRAQIRLAPSRCRGR